MPVKACQEIGVGKIVQFIQTCASVRSLSFTMFSLSEYAINVYNLGSVLPYNL